MTTIKTTTNYNLGNGKPLINREQNYVLDRRVLSVHSEDRDITKWPQANTFEIILPEQLLNVQSLRIVQCTFPGKHYTFRKDYQNTKLIVTVLGGLPQTITIQEGYYTAAELATELQNALIAVDAGFLVMYDNVKNKLFFGNTSKLFTIKAGEQITYTLSNCEQPIVWNNYANWGLPFNLGFAKDTATSVLNTAGLPINYFTGANQTKASSMINYIEPPTSLMITGDTCFYLEVEKYNSYDEMYPYNQSTRLMNGNNAYAGKVNSAFAKIPIQSNTEYSYDSRTFFTQNIVHYDPPIERIARLKFRFRFHDGRLVDFQNYPFDFSIEFNCLRSEIAKSYNVRVPGTYIL
jgi:hypothetical protein